ncbi:MAG: HAD hydrolase-like protein [Minisyncoccia bacterium]
MKYIFDFDDVLFKNTDMLKPRIFHIISREAGVTEEKVKERYQKNRIEFSLVNFIKTFFTEPDMSKIDHIFKDIMSESHKFLNMELIEEIKKIDKNDLYIVTNGENDFNWSKLAYSGVMEYFLTEHIEVVPGSKRDAIHKICDANPNEEIIFIDDRDYFIEDLDSPKLKPLLYTKETRASVHKTLRELSKNRASELRMK